MASLLPQEPRMRTHGSPSGGPFPIPNGRLVMWLLSRLIAHCYAREHFKINELDGLKYCLR
jgi:hypothetical protein